MGRALPGPPSRRKALLKKTAIWTACVIIAGAVVFVGLRGCTAMPWNRNRSQSGVVSISITRDYGSKVLKQGEAKLRKDESVMEALKSFASVETEYGGGFISSIEGLASTSGSSRQDWFYYINGTMADVGAEDIILRSGDSVWWDYHEWHGGDYSPAVVGAYPAPFTRGYKDGKTKRTILYGEGLEAGAREVGDFLRKSGVQVEYSDQPSSFEHGKGPSMFFMTFGQAQRTPCVEELLIKQRGAFVAVEGGKLVVMDADGEPADMPASVACAIVSTAGGMGDSAPVWFVLCENAGGAGQAVRLLTDKRSSLKDKVGVVVDTGGRVYRVPR